MPMTHKQVINLTHNLRLTRTDLQRAAHDWPDSSNDAVTTLHPEAIAVGEHEPASERIKVSVGLIGHVNDNVLLLAKVALQIAVYRPIVIGEYSPLHPHLLGAAAMVAYNARDEYLTEAAGELLDARRKDISQIVDGLVRC